jgi:hypothetical protein
LEALELLATRSRCHRVDRRQYEPTVLAPRLSRLFVQEVLSRWGCDRLDANVALLTAELVADAIRQAPTSIALHIELDRSTVRVEVVAAEPGLIADASSERIERHVARRLVEAVADDWGSDVDRGRTTTWFSMPASGAARVPLARAG